MRTAVLRVDAPPAGESAYRVTLRSDDGSAGWQDRPTASGEMAADLADATLPLDENGQSIPAAGIVPYLLDQPLPSKTFLAIGQLLFRQLLPEPILGSWRDLLAAPAGGGLRTILDIRPEPLRRLPWELLAAGEKRLFLDSKNPWFRGPGSAAPVAPELGPLRILVVVGSRQTDILAEQEVSEIQRAARPFGVAYVLREPERQRLNDVYRDWQPHIVHFICHGQSTQDGPVLLIGDAGRWRFARQDIVNWPSEWKGRLAILNACRTETQGQQPSPALHEATSSLAEAFLERGFAAVIGMQADIDAAAAASFSAPFYGAIARGLPLDVALTEARHQIGTEDLDARDWALPALTIHGDPDQILAIAKPEPSVAVNATREFDMIRAFIDRSPERMGLWRRLDPEGFGLEPQGLSLLTGDESIGKTWLIWKVLWICAMRGRTVRYVDLQGKDTLDWLGVLRRIRDGSAPAGPLSSPLQGPMPAGAFAAFNHTVNHVAAGKLPPRFEPRAKPVVDRGKPYQAGVEDGVERIFDAFSAALQQVVTDSGPIVMAIDHLGPVNDAGGVGQAGFRVLVEQLLRKAQLGLVRDIRLIVAMTGSELASYWPQELDARDLMVPVPGIEIDDFVPLAREFCLHLGLQPDDFEPAAQGMAQVLKQPWKPKQLALAVQAALGTSP